MSYPTLHKAFAFNKGLRIARKKHNIDLSPVQCHLLLVASILSKRGLFAASSFDDKLRLMNRATTLHYIYTCLAELVELGYLRQQDNKYHIAPTGITALKNIDKCINSARLDR